MREFFDKLFAKYSLDKETRQKYENEFTGAILLTMIYATLDKLSDEEMNLLQICMREERFADVIKLVVGKYKNDELRKMIEEHVRPLVESYILEVVK